MHACPIAASEGKETGGLNVYVLELSKALGELGFIVDIFTRSQNPKKPNIVAVAENVRVIHLTAGSQRPYPKQHLRRHIPEFTQNIRSFIENNQLHYDILHCHYYLSGLVGLALQSEMKPRVPLIMTFHTLGLMKNLVARSLLEQEGKFRLYAEQRLVKASDHIVSTSDADRAYLMYLYRCPADKNTVVHPGVDATLFHPIDQRFAKLKIGADPKHKIILAVGRIEPLKGFDILMYALKIMNEKYKTHQPTCLWIVGGDTSQKKSEWSEELRKLEQLRHTLGVSTTVHIVSQKPQQMLPNFYNAADVVVMPSHYESFGMVALEAMACGTPVITTNVTGVSRLIGQKHPKMVISANDPLLLADRIEHLIVQSKHRKTMQEKLRESITQYSWHHAASVTQSVYKKMWKEYPGLKAA